MTKSATATLAQVVSSLEEQRTKTAALGAALDVQIHRIAEMQAELDGVLRQTRARSQALLPELPLHSGNGNGHLAESKFPGRARTRHFGPAD